LSFVVLVANSKFEKDSMLIKIIVKSKELPSLINLNSLKLTSAKKMRWNLNLK